GDGLFERGFRLSVPPVSISDRAVVRVARGSVAVRTHLALLLPEASTLVRRADAARFTTPAPTHRPSPARLPRGRAGRVRRAPDRRRGPRARRPCRRCAGCGRRGRRGGGCGCPWGPRPGGARGPPPPRQSVGP